MRKIIILFVLLLCSIIGNAATWTEQGHYDTSWYDDLSVTFEINTAKELAGLAYLCNNGTSFDGKTINLKKDINLVDYEWDPISVFNGTFNGGFHKISNLKIDYYDEHFGAKKGFIINNRGDIKGIEIQGTILLASRGYGAISAGGICVENIGNIIDCNIDCVVSAYSKSSATVGYNHKAGGICAINKGSIINCLNKGNISAKPSIYDYQATQNCAGGIAGQNEGEIVNCFNYGDIYTVVGFDSSTWKISWGLPYGYSGGICGYNTGTINNSVSIAIIEAEVVRLGKIDGTNAFGGGITAYNSGTVENAYYSSSKTITAPHIVNDGLKLGDTQLNNTSYAFTDLLNKNVSSFSNTEVCFWANSVSQNDNIPFLLNGFAANIQVENISQNNATFTAIPSDIVSSAIIRKGFEYKKKTDLSYAKVYASDVFSVEVSNLELSAIYEVRAFVTTHNSTVYFNNREFTTSPMIIETQEATSITATTAVLKGKFQAGSTSIKSQGFLWKAEDEPDFHVVYTNGQEFEYKLEHLSPSTMYYYQAFVLTTNGENLYGNQLSFSTQSIAIMFNDDTTIDRNQMVLRGNINVNISTDVTIEYKKSSENIYSKTFVKSSNEGDFECTLSGLSPNTYYDCRAYIIYNSSYTYSQVSTFKTLSVLVQTLTPLLDTAVTFRGEVIGGTDTGTVGFEYRDANYPDLIASDYIYSDFINSSFFAQTSNVINGNEYKYRAFYQDIETNTTYGEWVYFTPTDVVSAINGVVNYKKNKVAGYYDLKGRKYNEPKKGLNIIRYSDGSARKVMIK